MSLNIKSGEDCTVPNKPWNMGTTSVVILGAGFSAAATKGRAPLMNNFFETIDISRYKLLASFIEDVDGDIPTANIESVLVAIEQIRCSPEKALEGWGNTWKTAYAAIRNQLTSYILERLKTGMNLDLSNWAVKILAASGPSTTVISMNYDNIAECILSNRKGMIHQDPLQDILMTCPHCKMRSLLNKACSCGSRDDPSESDWQGALLKPHGSIAWKRCINPNCCSYECLVADAQCRPFEPCKCPYCGHMCVPAIILPSMNKDLNSTPEIAVMWQSAKSAIERAQSLLIFGFSLPTSDTLFTHLIRKAICHSRQLSDVAVIDLNPNCVVERFRKCLPKDFHPNISTFTVPKAELPNWLNLFGQ